MEKDFGLSVFPGQIDYKSPADGRRDHEQQPDFQKRSVPSGGPGREDSWLVSQIILVEHLQQIFHSSGEEAAGPQFGSVKVVVPVIAAMDGGTAWHLPGF